MAFLVPNFFKGPNLPQWNNQFLVSNGEYVCQGLISKTVKQSYHLYLRVYLDRFSWNFLLASCWSGKKIQEFGKSGFHGIIFLLIYIFLSGFLDLVFPGNPAKPVLIVHHHVIYLFIYSNHEEFIFGNKFVRFFLKM